LAVGKSQLCQKRKRYLNGLETSEQIDRARLAKLVSDQKADPGIELAVDRSRRVK
jgi:hypothetical protein